MHGNVSHALFRTKARCVAPLPILDTAGAISTRVSAPAPLAEVSWSRITFPSGSSSVRRSC
eukprot:1119435-Rhodomonas_salina.1